MIVEVKDTTVEINSNLNFNEAKGALITLMMFLFKSLAEMDSDEIKDVPVPLRLKDLEDYLIATIKQVREDMYGKDKTRQAH